MAEPAYQLEYFAPRKEKDEKKARVRVVKKEKSAFAKQMIKMARAFAAILLVVALMTGVLYTQTSVTELQSDLVQAEKDLTDQQAMHAYLAHEMESRANTRTIEQRAKELGFAKTGANQITYVRAEDSNSIELKESAFELWWASVKETVAGWIDSLFSGEEEEEDAPPEEQAAAEPDQQPEGEPPPE